MLCAHWAFILQVESTCYLTLGNKKKMNNTNDGTFGFAGLATETDLLFMLLEMSLCGFRSLVKRIYQFIVGTGRN